MDARTAAGQKLRADLMRCLAATAEGFPLHEAERQVLGLVCNTLHEYSCLEGCAALRRYVETFANVTTLKWYMLEIRKSEEQGVRCKKCCHVKN